jgi:membrane protease YdiL (CAAX protease family)
MTVSFVGLLIIKKYFKKFKQEFKIGNFNIFILNAVFLVAYFFSRYLLQNFKFYISSFKLEIFFNFFTGTFEEIFFRGIILVGIAQYLKPVPSILLSAFLFAIWHYDVVNYPFEYFHLFAWGVYAGFCYLYGSSLLSLSLFHFLWDQIYFGLDWGGVDKSLNFFLINNIFFLTVFFIITLIIIARRSKISGPSSGPQ